ncbi:hypothetical protein TREMEDRAFT_39553 [Tremella mesenterica DSM 1558]|uniref:uncharacterized protein n=1 Tax=Tremella mesenterica (strain ATCC 24925 / CBS 8224 / DSM 1558 / NBRC 9311 / NRRL Y-6157 / RJB 2259-6 / UBC 559-6) TaxID=578456 RepID=UPI0003F4A39F|nr:uncharacterized protein TREMEDRAFT_39553 [Tremella mesenterica DSM 1558]EIW68641.1 hypothetical protein TREMEDRAFT_39553 [Tremella mesenterica DSM 1558]
MSFVERADEGRGGRIRAGRRNRERDRLMSGGQRQRGKSQAVMGSKWLGRLWAFVPTQPLTIVTPHSLTLAPLTPASTAWPYHPHTELPFTAESKNLDEVLKPVGVLVGVFTTDAGTARRHMIRQSWASHWRSRSEGTEGVRVRFVMARPRPRYAHAVQLEMEAFNDIIFLDMPEKMNSGKTYAFFSWAAENATVPDWEYPTLSQKRIEGQVGTNGQDIPEGTEAAPSPIWRGERRPDYVIKADEDSFIMLGELERRLRAAPRSKAYWGYLVKNLFMGGECYGLSFDLVQYIASSPALRTLTYGKEDKLVSKWIRMHPAREEIVWVAERCWIYDHPKAPTVYAHGFLFPSEVARVRKENTTGLSSSVLALRGGHQEAADAYSSVSKFGIPYKAPCTDLSATERVEALIEGSPLSRLRDEPIVQATTHTQAYSSSKSKSNERFQVMEAYANRPNRTERFLGDEKERGGTVVVHYIKKDEWFVETMVALLGTADEQGVWHRGVGVGLGALERSKGRVVGGVGEGEGVKVGKDGGL